MVATTLLVFLSLVGTSLAAQLPYIIGGTTVRDATRWSWQGSLRKGSRHHCGCSLISPQWAVTAAHCLTLSASSYEVVFGELDRTLPGHTRRAVKQIIKHEDYGKGNGSYPNDIAVIMFLPVTLSDNITTIDMVTTEQAGNTDCYITGWGYTTVGGGPVELARYLQQAHINVYTNEECRNSWGSKINDGHVCIGGQGVGACNGDSGGPLVCKVGDDYQLVGVTSWVASGCYVFVPSVYSRITYFRQWVMDNTGVST